MDHSSKRAGPAGPEGSTGAERVPGFEEFVAGRERHLLRTAFLLTGGDAHLAEDLVQEALGRVFLKWRRVSRMENPSGYAQAALVNTFLSYRRRRSSTERVTDVLPETGVDDPDPALRLTLLRALAGLSPADRAVLVLRFWEDRGVEETAGVLRIGESAVRTRTRRALVRLRAVLGTDLDALVGRSAAPAGTDDYERAGARHAH
ncbi:MULTISPECIES: SigE family RNA polymerase sigma factor [Kitasatospora]|uniref:Putative RNA polymerase ECF subfamily sigma factor n=1 Tax=Kitasatospora setae (strain ATCC 33774 / DSM 43861 / JCM 3304 / KCC A-0304 / NBRC 14216 / KM-6054) TaxID=452652 RepID=E4N6N8_KITSK|nr:MULTISPECIES: SigE family RNA polymerase sigma factor [Kitasatospora]BAJ26869.1 putative RNA polymerase ECF subfamily sigma factor [Kitasatospora setae KM-6054]